MRLPTRKSEILKRTKQSDDPVYLTKDGIEKIKKTIERLKREHKQAVKDVQRTGEMGDFSENAEYQEAKGRMRRLINRITILEERLKIAVPIEKTDDGIVQLGSTVVLASEDGQKQYEIVGPQETDPTKGRISHVSPLGKELIGRQVGDVVTIREKEYGIIEVN